MNTESLNIRIFRVLIVFMALLMPLSTAKADNTPLSFTARNGNVTVRFDIKYVTHTIQYSTNGTDWIDYTSNTSITLLQNQTIRFRAAENQTDATPFANSADANFSRFYFTSTDNGTVEASGNIMSLYGPDCPDLQLQPNAFASLFEDCTLLTTPPELPSSKPADFCYSNMFKGCTALATAPALPATIVSGHCYGAMFYGCTSLVTPPALPAIDMVEGCYESMFYGCTSLDSAPALHTLNLANDCYMDMFNGCTSLATAPALRAARLADNCYKRMFRGCTSLTKIPELPATELAKGCYQEMFRGCTSLTMMPELPSVHLADSCYKGMFFHCKSLSVLPQLPADSLPTYCYYEMFAYDSSLHVNTTGSGKEWKIAARKTAEFALSDMFLNTIGAINETMSTTPSVNTTYYIVPCAIKETKSNGNWNDPATWDGGKVPIETDAVTIKNDIVIPAEVDAHCESIVFQDGGKLTVAPSATLHATTITNNDPTRLTIKSDASNMGTVRFSNPSANQLKATVEIYLKGNADGSDGPEWQYRGFVGTPDVGQTIEDIVIFQWNETKNNTDYWVRVLTNTYEPWKGYAITNLDSTNEIRSYTTTLEPTNKHHRYDLTRTWEGEGNAAAKNCGVNVVTNSYSAPVVMDEVEMDIDVEHTFYFFNTRSRNAYKSDSIAAITTYPIKVYEKLTTNPYIPAGQSFAVRATIVNGDTISIPASAISTINSGRMYAPAKDEPLSMVKITVESDDAIDELFLLQMDECTSDFDNGYDGTKIFASVSHQIYAQNSYGQCAVNADRTLLGQYVGFKPVSNGSQNVRLWISSIELDGYDELYLYDYVTGTYVEITEDEASYSFTSTGDETPRRFQIVGKATDGTEYNPKEKARIEVAGNEIYLMNFDREDAQVILTDAAGRTLWRVNAKNGTTFTLPELPVGVYFVSCGNVSTKYVQR